MAFNLAKYNLNPYNVQGGHVKWIRADGSETVNAFIGSALQIYVSAIGNERVDESTVGAPTLFATAKGFETVSELVAKGQPTVLLYPIYLESVNAEIDLDAEITPYPAFVENVGSEIILGADAYLNAELVENIGAETSLGANIYPQNLEGFELISESASLDIIDTLTCLLTTTLAPGQQIIIDADSYTVLLDGENAIDIQSGDWIDELNRSTTDIMIGAASGVSNLSARLIYTERYL